MIETIETDDQKRERIQLRRVQNALRHLPDAIGYVHTIAIGGQIERGETLKEWTAPMRITAADDADAAYVQLIEWVEHWSRFLTFAPPAGHAVAWRNLQAEHVGFRAGTTSEGVAFLVKLQTMWLLIRQEQIRLHPHGWNYFTAILDLEAGLRGKYPRSQRKERGTRSRPCPVCGQPSVGADWFSADPLDVRIACTSCGYQVPAADVEDWMLPVLEMDDDEESADAPA